MSRTHAQTRKLLGQLCVNPAARLTPDSAGGWAIRVGEQASEARVSARLVASLRSSGLLLEEAPGVFAAGPVALAWLKRQGAAAPDYLAQHHALESRAAPDQRAGTVLVNTEESPIAALARRPRPGGEPWIGKHASEAGERLRRDFELAQLQPRITANWSGNVRGGRRSEGRTGSADLTETALSARIRIDRAVEAVGPELSGALLDVCCFLKGLETVERERQWPARSAKLVLRLALEALARHYGLSAAATGSAKGARLRHWGAADYRPEIS